MVVRMVMTQLMQVLLGRELAASPRLGPYAVFTVADFLAFCAIYIPYTHLPPLAVAHGVTPAKVSTISTQASTHYLSGRNLNAIYTPIQYLLSIYTHADIPFNFYTPSRQYLYGIYLLYPGCAPDLSWRYQQHAGPAAGWLDV